MIDNSLAHVGVKGMRWGVRKGKRAPSEDYVKARQLKAKGIRAMSNAELKAVNERLQLEASFKNLNPTKISKGRKKVKQFLEDLGTMNKAVEISKGAAGTAVKSLLKVAIVKALG